VQERKSNEKKGERGQVGEKERERKGGRESFEKVN